MKRLQIIKEQKLYLSFLPHVRKMFGKIPGVDLIGLGAKERGGISVDEWAFRFYVHRKLPLQDIAEEERIPVQIFGIQTDVIPSFEKETLICASTSLAVNEEGYRDDGIRGGVSIRNEYFENNHTSGYGTLGILGRRKSDNALIGLTCSHVANAAADSITAINTKIGQPKYWISCCCCPRGYIGDVTKATSSADLDCAIIEIHEDIREKVTSNGTENQVEGILGVISGADAVICFESLQKYGRATGLTTGKVTDVAFGTNQMLIERTGGNPGDPFACHGDSGAVVVNSGNKVVGLLVAAQKSNLTRAIVTHIKPVMVDLGITIAGTDAASIGEPVGGGAIGCELFAWPGGQSDPTLNPAEIFASTDFGMTGNVNWDVSGGAPGAVIIETGTQTANGLASISVRYDTVSPSKSPNHAAWVKASDGTNEVTKFRTVFIFVARTVNTSSLVESSNTKRFAATGGTGNTQAGVAVPGTDGATWFLAKTETVYDIGPQDIGWSGSGGISFVTGAPAGIKGNIIARRETRFVKGEQANGAANRTHSDQVAWISAGNSSADDLQGPTDAAPNELFRMANEGFDPANLLQGYWRADFRDFLEFHNGTQWIRITPFAEWFANLTAKLNATGTVPPDVGDLNETDAGTTTAVIPNTTPVANPADTEIYAGLNEQVVLNSAFTDADNDIAVINWVQTSGNPVVLSAGGVGPSVNFNSPAANGDLEFDVTATDSTQGLAHAPGNSVSAPAHVVVRIVEWLAWPGGQVTTDRNPFEQITSAEMGLAGAVDWDTGTGTIRGEIIQVDGAAHAGTTANGTVIRVRYDAESPGPGVGDVVIIKATDGAGKVGVKLRTVFKVLARPVNTSAAMHPNDNLSFLPNAGTNTKTAGVVTPGVNAATRFGAKIEVIYDITPQNIRWSRRGVLFRYDQPGVPPTANNVKMECIARRENQFTDGGQAAAAANRTHTVQAWANDGTADSQDFQFPTDAIPNQMFRRDTPSFDPTAFLQEYFRDDFREYIEFHNGFGWVRICPYAPWFANLTGSLSGTGAPPAVLIAGALNSSGTGTTAGTIPNSPPVITGPANTNAAKGSAVVLNATATDPDNDVATSFTWSQTSGTPVIAGPFAGNPLNFVAPASTGLLVFSVVVDDSTNGLARNSGNARSIPRVVNVTVI